MKAEKKTAEKSAEWPPRRLRRQSFARLAHEKHLTIVFSRLDKVKRNDFHPRVVLQMRFIAEGLSRRSGDSFKDLTAVSVGLEAKGDPAADPKLLVVDPISFLRRRVMVRQCMVSVRPLSSCSVVCVCALMRKDFGFGVWFVRGLLCVSVDFFFLVERGRGVRGGDGVFAVFLE